MQTLVLCATLPQYNEMWYNVRHGRSFQERFWKKSRRFDTGQHCFRSPIISALRIRRFAHPPLIASSHPRFSAEVFVNDDANARSFREREGCSMRAGRLKERGKNGNGITTRRKRAASPPQELGGGRPSRAPLCRSSSRKLERRLGAEVSRMCVGTSARASVRRVRQNAPFSRPFPFPALSNFALDVA